MNSRFLKLISSRLILLVIAVVLQIVMLVSWIYRTSLSHNLSPIITLFSYALVVRVVNTSEDPSYKLTWCVLILVWPILGMILYVLCAGRKMPKKLADGTTRSSQYLYRLLRQDDTVMERLEKEEPDLCRTFRYGQRMSQFPVYGNTEAKYFGSGEELWPVLLQELRNARKFIFMEFFIIDEGEVWNSVLEVLKQKVQEGVEVKLIYDDFGCAAKLPRGYDRKLNEMGIETYRFNKLRPALIIQMNNRDHRKIVVIDNQVAFTGGVNLADEYMNRIERFGKWRDSAIMLKGDAVWSMTVMFLGMFSWLKGSNAEIDYTRYRLKGDDPGFCGFFQPFSDTPTDDADTGVSMHLNIISSAKNYVYLETPYLIPNNSVESALTLAAQNGVAVRILVPHLPDKRYVFYITQSYYEPLIAAGVRIYEYTPGFNHCKNIVSDDRIASVGTVNSDYRSYYLHFEDGVIFADNEEILRIREDFLRAVSVSQEITMEDCRKVPLYKRVSRRLLKIATPLL